MDYTVLIIGGICVGVVVIALIGSYVIKILIPEDILEGD